MDTAPSCDPYPETTFMFTGDGGDCREDLCNYGPPSTKGSVAEQAVADTPDVADIMAAEASPEPGSVRVQGARTTG